MNSSDAIPIPDDENAYMQAIPAIEELLATANHAEAQRVLERHHDTLTKLPAFMLIFMLRGAEAKWSDERKRLGLFLQMIRAMKQAERA